MLLSHCWLIFYNPYPSIINDKDASPLPGKEEYDAEIHYDDAITSHDEDVEE